MRVMTRDGLFLGGAEVPIDDRGRYVGYRLALIVAAPVVGLALVAAALVWLREPDGGGERRGPSVFLALLQPGGYWAAGLLAAALAIAATAWWRRPRLRLLLLGGTALALAAPLAYRAASPRVGQDPALGFAVELLALPVLSFLLLCAAAVRLRVHPWRREAWVRRPVELAVAGGLAVALATGLVFAAGVLVRRGSLATGGWLDTTVNNAPLAVPEGPGPLRWASAVPQYHGKPGYRIVGAGRGVVAIAADRPGRSPDGRVWSGISVRDAVTGAERWHLYGSTWNIWAGGILEGGTVVLVGSGPFPGSASGDSFAMGLDARTGRARWQRTLSPYVALPGVPQLGSGYGQTPVSIDGNRWLVLLDVDPGPHHPRTRLTVVDGNDGEVVAVLNANPGCQFLSATTDRQRLYAEQVCAPDSFGLPLESAAFVTHQKIVTRVLDGGYDIDGRPLWTASRVLPQPVAYVGFADAQSDSAIVWFDAVVDDSQSTKLGWHSVRATYDALTGRDLSDGRGKVDNVAQLGGGLVLSVGGSETQPVLNARDLRRRVLVWSATLPGRVLTTTSPGVAASGIVYVALDASASRTPQLLRLATYHPANGQPLPDTPVATIETTPCPATNCVSLANYSLWQAGNAVVAVAVPWTAPGSPLGTAERAQQVWVWSSR